MYIEDLLTLTLHQTSLAWLNRGKVGPGMWHAWNNNKCYQNCDQKPLNKAILRWLKKGEAIISLNNNKRLAFVMEKECVLCKVGSVPCNQNSILEETRSRLKSRNVLSSSLLSKNISTKIYRTVILSVVLYGCETRSFTLRNECRLRVMTRIFGPKSNEITEECRRLHNEELSDLYPSPTIIRVFKSRRMRWGACST